MLPLLSNDLTIKTNSVLDYQQWAPVGPIKNNNDQPFAIGNSINWSASISSNADDGQWSMKWDM
jgi:hypothetical protein